MSAVCGSLYLNNSLGAAGLVLPAGPLMGKSLEPMGAGILGCIFSGDVWWLDLAPQLRPTGPPGRAIAPRPPAPLSDPPACGRRHAIVIV